MNLEVEDVCLGSDLPLKIYQMNWSYLDKIENHHTHFEAFNDYHLISDPNLIAVFKITPKNGELI